MALDAKLRRFAQTSHADIQQMLDRQESLTHGHDEVRHDPAAGIVGFLRAGEPLWTARAEHIGTFYPDIGMFRWVWALRSPAAKPSPVDEVMREGSAFGYEQLTANHIGHLEEADVTLLTQLAARIAKALGVLRVAQGSHFVYYALYDAPQFAPPPKGYTLPPAAAQARSGSSAPPPRVPSATLPTMPPPGKTPGQSPPPQRPIREPSRTVVAPLAQLAVAELSRALPDYVQALLLVNVNREEAKGRFFVVLVASDAAGNLRPLDPSARTVAAAGQLIKDDYEEGNGPWHRVAIRIAPRGAATGVMLTVFVD